MAYETGHQVTGEHRSGLISSKAAYFHQVDDHHDQDYYDGHDDHIEYFHKVDDRHDQDYDGHGDEYCTLGHSCHDDQIEYFHLVDDRDDQNYYDDRFVVIDFNWVIFAGEM